jgi:hypothetical protein
MKCIPAKKRERCKKKAHKKQNAKKGWRSLKKSEKKAKYIFGKNNIGNPVRARQISLKCLLTICY